jgi:hypothetical protein
MAKNLAYNYHRHSCMFLDHVSWKTTLKGITKREHHCTCPRMLWIFQFWNIFYSVFLLVAWIEGDPTNWRIYSKIGTCIWHFGVLQTFVVALIGRVIELKYLKPINFYMKLSKSYVMRKCYQLNNSNVWDCNTKKSRLNACRWSNLKSFLR